MKGKPAVPGGPLESKPTWLNTSGCSATSAFLFAVTRGGRNYQGRTQDQPAATVPYQIAPTASAFE
jgi:hypothetical protein